MRAAAPPSPRTAGKGCCGQRPRGTADRNPIQGSRSLGGKPAERVLCGTPEFRGGLPQNPSSRERVSFRGGVLAAPFAPVWAAPARGASRLLGGCSSPFTDSDRQGFAQPLSLCGCLSEEGGRPTLQRETVLGNLGRGGPYWFAGLYAVLRARVTYRRWDSGNSRGRLMCVVAALIQIRSDQISRSVLSDSLRPHESQHTRPPCPSPTPGVHSDSRPSSQ